MIKDDLVLIRDFLTERQMDLVKKEIRRLQDEVTQEYIPKEDLYGKPDGAISRHRCYLDAYYEARRDESDILRIMQDMLFSDRVYEIVEKINCYSMLTMRHSSTHETQLTSYQKNDRYYWHRDNDARRIRFLNYALYIQFSHKAKGGELLISDDIREPFKPAITIKPEHNLIAIFPSQYMHKVNEVQTYSDNILDGRITINGHVGFK